MIYENTLSFLISTGNINQSNNFLEKVTICIASNTHLYFDEICLFLKLLFFSKQDNFDVFKNVTLFLIVLFVNHLRWSFLRK